MVVLNDVPGFGFNERQLEQVADLNGAIEQLADAIERGSRADAADLAREVEVEAYALRMMLTGGRDVGGQK